MNNYLEYQRHIRYQFESFCKKVIAHERCDYLRWKLRYVENETNFSDLPAAYLEGLNIPDGYPGEEYVFHVYGYQVPIRNEQLIDALLDIGSEERSILLLYYSLGLKDPEIAKLLHTSRSRIQRLRAKTFNELQKKMR